MSGKLYWQNTGHKNTHTKWQKQKKFTIFFSSSRLIFQNTLLSVTHIILGSIWLLPSHWYDQNFSVDISSEQPPVPEKFVKLFVPNEFMADWRKFFFFWFYLPLTYISSQIRFVKATSNYAIWSLSSYTLIKLIYGNCMCWLLSYSYLNVQRHSVNSVMLCSKCWSVFHGVWMCVAHPSRIHVIWNIKPIMDWQIMASLWHDTLLLCW